jgi:lipoate-protein ligase A
MIVEGTAAEEQAWIEAAIGGEVALPAARVWRYRRPAVVLGRSQRPDAAMAERARRAGVDLVERPTGGGAVLAGPWLLGATVAVAAGDARVTPSIPASYGWIAAAHARWLGAAGVPAEVTRAIVDPGELRWACYAGLGHGELVLAGRKIVGLAQARRRAAVAFVAGTLLAPPPWEILCEVLDRPRADAGALARSTAACSEVIAVDEARLAGALDRELGVVGR